MDFDVIYKEFSPRIFRVCLGYINNYDKAKDLTQDTFIAVWENLAKFREDANIATWIYRIATNKCLRQIENENRSKKIAVAPFMEIEDHVDDNKEAKHHFLRDCIAELPEMERLIIGLYLEDLPQEKIAEIVGMSHANVRVKVHRIKEILTKKFKTNGQF